MAHPHFSRQYRLDNTGKNEKRADPWLVANQGLFHYPGGTVLRNLNPTMYAKFHSVVTTLPSPLRPLCGVWGGCAINQRQREDGNAHLDWRDSPFGLNVVVAWGNFETATLNLWQLGMSLEVRKGDAVLFLGRILTHNAASIMGGGRRRNVVDCFIHQSLCIERDLVVAELKSNKTESADRDGTDDVGTEDEDDDEDGYSDVESK